MVLKLFDYIKKTIFLIIMPLAIVITAANNDHLSEYIWERLRNNINKTQ